MPGKLSGVREVVLFSFGKTRTLTIWCDGYDIFTVDFVGGGNVKCERNVAFYRDFVKILDSALLF